jgi:hypothetical protein
MDPLTLEMNMVNEHAKASAAATIATAPAPAPAPALLALAQPPPPPAEVEVEIVTEVATEAPAGAALTRPHKRRSLPMINQVGTRTIEENIAKAVAQEKESELALAPQKAELGGFKVKLSFFECVAEVRGIPKFFKILRNEMKNYPILIRMGMY